MDGMATNKKGRKVMHLKDNDKLDEAVCQWFVQDMPVIKAVQLHKQLHERSTVPSVQASRGYNI